MPQSSVFAIYMKAGAIVHTCILRAAHILFPDLNESIPEFLNTERVNNGIDGGVAMTEQDSHIQKAHGIVTTRTEESDAIQDMQWQPANSEQEEHQCKRFCQLEFFPIISSGVGLVGSDLLVELLVDHVEDLGVDEQHEDERRQHPAKEVEIDHVLHTDDILKLTGYEKVSTHSAVGL